MNIRPDPDPTRPDPDPTRPRTDLLFSIYKRFSEKFSKKNFKLPTMSFITSQQNQISQWFIRRLKAITFSNKRVSFQNFRKVNKKMASKKPKKSILDFRVFLMPRPNQVSKSNVLGIVWKSY